MAVVLDDQDGRGIELFLLYCLIMFFLLYCHPERSEGSHAERKRIMLRVGFFAFGSE